MKEVEEVEEVEEMEEMEVISRVCRRLLFSNTAGLWESGVK